MVTAGELAYTDITTRVLRRVIQEHPEIFIEEAYGGRAPPYWKNLWLKLIEEESHKYNR